ncbi:MAG: tyrosine-type recombinase/integrase [Sporichthyaceae bacterium]
MSASRASARGSFSKSVRPRGVIERLPSGNLRVKVFTGYDPVTGKRHEVTELVSVRGITEREARREAERVRTRLVNQVDERRNPKTGQTMDQLFDRWLEVIDVEQSTRNGYIGKIEKHLRPTVGTLPVGKLNAEIIDSLYVQLRRCREHCRGRAYLEHRTAGEHVCDEHRGAACVPARPKQCEACRRQCRDHVCTPLSSGSIRVVHSILKSSLNRAVRWQWIAINPISFVEPPTISTPDPSPPTPTEAAVIVTNAFEDPDWGALIWLAMTTGARRGELAALRWSDIDLERGSVTIGRSVGQIGGTTWEKETKTHQRRVLSLDPETVAVLTEHHERGAERCRQLGVELEPSAFVFSNDPDSGRAVRPDGVTQRYGRMAKRLGITTHFHALRHYSATELIGAGVDPRTVAGRLGHGGGGSTTLRVYSAWLPESDRLAASALAARMPQRPTALHPVLDVETGR